MRYVIRPVSQTSSGPLPPTKADRAWRNKAVSAAITPAVDTQTIEKPHPFPAAP